MAATKTVTLKRGDHVLTADGRQGIVVRRTYNQCLVTFMGTLEASWADDYAFVYVAQLTKTAAPAADAAPAPADDDDAPALTWTAETPPLPRFFEGQRVVITSGAYAGKRGSVDYIATVNRQNWYQIRLDAFGGLKAAVTADALQHEAAHDAAQAAPATAPAADDTADAPAISWDGNVPTVRVAGQDFTKGQALTLTGALAVANGSETGGPVEVLIAHVYGNGTATLSLRVPTAGGYVHRYQANYPLAQLVAAPAAPAPAPQAPKARKSAAPFAVGQRVVIVRPDVVTRGQEWVLRERLGQRATVRKCNYDMVSSTPPSAPLVIGRVGKRRSYRSVSVEFDNGDRLALWLPFLQDAADYDAAQRQLQADADDAARDCGLIPAAPVAPDARRCACGLPALPCLPTCADCAPPPVAAAPAADARPDDALALAAAELDDWLARALQLARRLHERVYLVRMRPGDDASQPYEYALHLAGNVAFCRAQGWLFYAIMAQVDYDVPADADGMASCRDCGAPLGFRVGQPVFASLDTCAACFEAIVTGAGRVAPAAASC